MTHDSGDEGNQGREAWQREFSEHVVKEVFRLISAEEKNFGPEFAQEAAMTILASYICTFVFNGKQAESTHKHFGAIREAVENAVAAAFSGALSTLHNRDVEFYCLIRPVPVPANSIPC